MSAKLKLLALPLLILFLFAQFAEATLVRSSGRGALSRNFSQAFYYVDNQYLNEVGIIESAFEFDSPFAANSIMRAVGGGGRGLGAVPNDCIKGYTQDDVDAKDLEISYLQQDYDNGIITESEFNEAVAQLEAAIAGEPCVWQFQQGEALSAFGFFNLYFDTPDIAYDVNWWLDGNPLPGDVNTAGALLTPDGTINNGWVTLNTPATTDFAPGDYLLYVTVGLSSANGRFFWTSSEPGNEVRFEQRCIYKPNPDYDPDNFDDPNAQEPEIEVCGYNNISQNDYQVSDAPRFFASEPELLRILPASVIPTTPVNAPGSVVLFFTGLVILLLRRQLKAAN